MSASRLRSALTVLAFAGVALLAACQTPPPPPPPPPPPMPTPPAISLSSALIQDAAVFQNFLAKSAKVSPAFHTPADVSAALVQTASASSEQLLRGEIAYAAIAALQDPVFVASVRAYGADARARQDMAARLISNPDYGVAFGGADTAAARAMDAIKSQGRVLFDAGQAVRQSAYDVQKEDWSKQPVADRPQRLANAKSAALANSVATADQIASLRAAAVGQSPIPLAIRSQVTPPPYPPVIVRGLAVAALAALGDAGDENLISMAPMMTDGPTATCLHTAKLNLYQCLAVARPNYEDIFCVGQHAMMDIGQCVMIAAGAPPPAFEPPPPPTPPAKPAKPAKAKKHKH